MGLEGSGAFRRGRDRDRGLDGAFQYSRRGLRLRRRGAYGIHRVSGPRCQGLCRKVASLRSGGRRLAVRTSMEHPIGALPRTPFPASRDFPSRGNERYEGITASHILQVPFRCSPLWWLAPPPFPRKRGHYKAPLCYERLMKGMLRGVLFCPRLRGKSGAAG